MRIELLDEAELDLVAEFLLTQWSGNASISRRRRDSDRRTRKRRPGLNPPKWWIIEAKDPSGSGTWKVKFYHSTIRDLEKDGPAHDFYSVQSAIETLQNPTAIFQGLKRDGQANTYCYCGRPRRYTNANAQTPPMPGMVFLVFVLHGGVFLKARWEQADPGDHTCPTGWQSRFDKVVWKKP